MSTSTIVADNRFRTATWLAWVSDWIELTKPRISVLVLITVTVAAHLASWGQTNPWLILTTLVGTVGFAASASAFNQWLEIERDSKMARTIDRPLPAGRLTSGGVLFFGGFMLLFGLLVTGLLVNVAAAGWGLLTWATYVLIYTPLKTRTAGNTAVGAVAGALPLFIGWSAVGAPLDYRAWGLWLILFLWQFPHFMAIAWLYRADYAKGGFHMLTTVDPSGRRAGVQAVVAAAALIPVSLVPALGLPNSATVGYMLAACLLGVGQLGLAVWFFRQRNEISARWLLRGSLVYLPAVMLLLAILPWA